MRDLEVEVGVEFDACYGCSTSDQLLKRDAYKQTLISALTQTKNEEEEEEEEEEASTLLFGFIVRTFNDHVAQHVPTDEKVLRVCRIRYDILGLKG